MLRTALLTGLLLAGIAPALAQAPPRRDSFFWLGEINKASAVINAQEGLLDPALAPRIAAGLDAVLRAGDAPGGPRPATVIAFEPLLIARAGVEATLLHAGRSSQDMLSTVRAAAMRDEALRLAEALRTVEATMVRLAREHADTIVPADTNGVAAQPDSYGHMLLGHLAGLERDAQRLHEFYGRLDRSPMGTAVLNGTGWPLDRARMARDLGFPALVDNAYDAAQITADEMPVEAGAVATSIALHCGAYVQGVMEQYGQPRPWILLREGDGNTYVSSAMPQKRNPGLLNDTRAEASRVVTLGIGRAIEDHNIPPGMADDKSVADNAAVLDGAARMLGMWDRTLNALVISPERARDALNDDWTASEEIADTLMRDDEVPFRVGHHFASQIVEDARARDLHPADYPYADARRIYGETLRGMGLPDAALPMSEAQFRAALDPAAIVRGRVTSGGPQAAEMVRMLGDADREVAAQGAWIAARRDAIDGALASLDAEFAKLLPPSK